MRMAALLIDTSVTHLRLGSPYMHVPALVAWKWGSEALFDASMVKRNPES